MPSEDYFTNEAAPTNTNAYSVTPSTDASFYTPFLNTSRRRSSGRVQNAVLSTLMPPAAIPTDDERADDEAEDDEGGGAPSSFNPHNLTPALHASLVSEILSLRREVDSKNHFIDQLESTLDEAKIENETLQQDLTRNNKETRSIKRQLKSIEDSTLSSLEQLYRERDQANESASEFKSRLETTQKRLKAEQEKSQRTLAQWDQEKSQWTNARRQLEGRVHSAEARLKSVVAEVAAREVAMVKQLEQKAAVIAAQAGAEEAKAPAEHASPFSSPEKFLKRHSRQKDSVGSIRTGAPVMNLADELDDDDANDLNTDEEDALLDADEELLDREYRIKKIRESRHDSLQDSKARKILGMIPDGDIEALRSPTTPTTPTYPTATAKSPKKAILEEKDGDPEPSTPRASISQPLTILTTETHRPGMHERMDSVSTATMYSPPETPTQLSQWNAESVVESSVNADPPSPEVEANQRRKRDPLRIYVGNPRQSRSHSRTRSEPSPLRPMQHVEESIKGAIVSQQNVWDSGPLSAASQESFVTASGQKPQPITGTADIPEVPVVPAQVVSKPPQMVSSSTQTDTPPPSPLSPPPEPSHTPPAPPISSILAETKVVEEPPAPTRAAPLPPPSSSSPPALTSSPPTDSHPTASADFVTQVPSIAIHPPTSRPSSPSLPTVLPPGTRNASCQTDFPRNSPTAIMVSRGVQTGKIRVDPRPINLPPHLWPKDRSREKSQRFNRGMSLTGDDDDYEPDALEPGPAFISSTYTERKSSLPSRRQPEQSTVALVDDDEDGWTRLKKNLMLNSRIKSPQDVTQDKPDEDIEALSDNDDSARLPTNKLSSRGTQRGIRSKFDPPTPVPEDEKVTSHRLKDSFGSKSSWEKPSQPYSSRNVSSKSSRRSSQFDSNRRTRSPSATSAGSSGAWSRSITNSHFPPFAIPKRRSSARVTQSNHSRAKSRSGESSPIRRTDYKTKRTSSLRKSKSAFAILNNSRKSDSLSSIPQTPVSATSMGSDDTRPPVPPISSSFKAMFTGRSGTHARQPSNLSHRYSTTVVPTGNASSIGTSVQRLTVVDAVASTMVGEWMWKYVRKRKSFGRGSGSGDLLQDPAKSGDVRHKRWVWLSPHDRTVMWSNKQPTTGSALMGKAGRKLSIQSVLDVSDDSPLPKGADPKTVFSRSILVLTPDRALKFTATSLEAHYMWLTALSFLGNNTPQRTLDLAFLPVGQNGAASSLRPNSSSTKQLGGASKASRKPGRGQQTNDSMAATIHEDHSTSYVLPMSHPSATPMSEISDVAIPPSIPRLPSGSGIHNRKRSASGPSYPSGFSSSILNSMRMTPQQLNSTPSSGRTGNTSSAHSVRSAMFGSKRSNNVSSKSSVRNVGPAGMTAALSRNGQITEDDGESSGEEEAKSTVGRLFTGRRRGRRNSTTTATASTVSSRAKEVNAGGKSNKLHKQKYASKSDNEAAVRSSRRALSKKASREQDLLQQRPLPLEQKIPEREREHSLSSSRVSRVSTEYGMNKNFFDAGRIDPFDINSAGANPGMSDSVSRFVDTNMIKNTPDDSGGGKGGETLSRYRASSLSTSQNYVPQNPSGTGAAAAAATASFIASRQAVASPTTISDVDGGIGTIHVVGPPLRAPPPPPSLPPVSSPPPLPASASEGSHKKGNLSKDSVAPPNIEKERPSSSAREHQQRPGSSKSKGKIFNIFGRKEKKDGVVVKDNDQVEDEDEETPGLYNYWGRDEDEDGEEEEEGEVPKARQMNAISTGDGATVIEVVRHD